ncbi:MAG: hypothetical protein D3904_03500 [Candidatus Electrothrix sp. EH2]|nr:hypothetical protein [Candidatus Electrothrix sp. EH2]
MNARPATASARQIQGCFLFMSLSRSSLANLCIQAQFFFFCTLKSRCSEDGRENRWIKRHKVIPQDEFAGRYHRTSDPRQGRPAKNAGYVIGALIIKHKLTLSDEETVLRSGRTPVFNMLSFFLLFRTSDLRLPACLLRFASAWERIFFPLLKK